MRTHAPEPTAIRIAAEGARLEIDWSDGLATSLEGEKLRRACPCATCAKGPRELPREGLLVAGIDPAGSGALVVEFTDGHASGLFAHERLRALANAPEAPPPNPRMSATATGTLDAAAVRAGLEKLAGWTLEGQAIKKTFVLGSFARSLGFTVEVGLLAEVRNHHPDIDVRWDRVTLSLTTHDAGGVTEKDLRLAGEIDGIAR